MAGLVGDLVPKFCVFGDTVFVAHRLCAKAKGEVMRVHDFVKAFQASGIYTAYEILCSATTTNLMETFGSFVLTKLGEVFVKGKGMGVHYNLTGENGELQSFADGILSPSYRLIIVANPFIQRLEAEFMATFVAYPTE